MGEAKAKSRSKAQVLAGEERCIYCSATTGDSANLTLEHMPPRGIFIGRHRASGLEFATCGRCNQGSKAADTAAMLMAFISPRETANDPLLSELMRIKGAVDWQIPGLREELFDERRARRRWLWTPSGLLTEHVEVNADGPILRNHLIVFAAKLGMALYREHVGEPLPLDGAVYSMHFLNAGLSQQTADAMLRIMPIFGRLEQGRKTSEGQFEYRYNCDNKSILAAFAHFHNNLFVNVIATADPDTYGSVAGRLPNIATSTPELYLERLSVRGEGGS
jgi:uncharacterized membrane protein